MVNPTPASVGIFILLLEPIPVAPSVVASVGVVFVVKTFNIRLISLFCEPPNWNCSAPLIMLLATISRGSCAKTYVCQT
jgi:hypothetical protein